MRKSVNFRNICLVSFFTICLGLVSVFAQGGGNGGGSVGTNPLPQTAPAPDIIMRDSFGQGPDMMRPASGKGTLKNTALGVSMSGFWLEYPGNKDNRWITPDSGDTWRYCATAPNSYELFSPLQTVFGFEENTILCTLLNAPNVSATRPTALMPLPSNLSTPYELEFDGIYWRIPGAYFAVGLTSSGVTTNNLASSGSVVLVTKPNPADNLFSMIYELRLGGMNGQILASGTAEESEFFNQMKIRYNPQTRSIGASFKGMDLGTFATNIAPPKYAAIEGIGYADNFVIRRLP
ncbi:MAG TPA: hypothetical protein PKY59_17545 [Pyrinomonadaceae bacterium]|nr:hypothetical protein [Pyrinomonadaceae bacterium]